MVCYKEPSGKLSLESVWKRYLAGDWMNHLSIILYRRVAQTNPVCKTFRVAGARKLKVVKVTLGRIDKHLKALIRHAASPPMSPQAPIVFLTNSGAVVMPQPVLFHRILLAC